MHTLVQVFITLSSAVFWLYIDTVTLFNKPIKNAPFIHAVVSSIGHTAVCVYQPSILTNYPVIYNNPKDIYLLAPLVSFGYSFYDLYIGVKSKSFDNIMHGFMFVFYFSIMFYGDILPVSHLMLVCETSSIFLNLRVYKSTIIDMLFASTFFVYRLIITPSLFLIYVINPNNTYRLTCASGAIGLTILNAYWFSLIYSKYKKQPKEVEDLSE